MSYSVNMITTVADCDLLLSLAAKEKGDLEFRKISLERQRNSYAATAQEVAVELQEVSTELAALDALIASLPNGETRNENVTRQKRLELKLYLLQEKKDNYGAVALLIKEFDQAKLEKELSVTNEFTHQLLAHKATI